MYESTDKMVSHPKHYQSEKGIELIDVIEAFTADLTGIEAVDTGHLIRYSCRWMNKNGIQDLEKLMWYCQHLIDHLRKNEVEEEPLSEVEMKYDAEIILNSGLCFDTREKAEDIITRLGDIIEVYGYATVADLDELLGKLPDEDDRDFGWLSTDRMKVERTKYGFVANIPNAVPMSPFKKTYAVAPTEPKTRTKEEIFSGGSNEPKEEIVLPDIEVEIETEEEESK